VLVVAKHALVVYLKFSQSTFDFLQLILLVLLFYIQFLVDLLHFDGHLDHVVDLLVLVRDPGLLLFHFAFQRIDFIQVPLLLLVVEL